MTTGRMTTIARPYAVAAFEYASAKNALSTWEAMLDAAALLTQDAAVQQLLTNPKITTKELTELYCDVLTSLLDPEKIHFIRLLADYHRFAVLPDIAALFKSYCALAEKKLTVKVTSATKLDDKYKQKLVKALTARLQRHISLDCSVDADLLGGAVIVADDTVIDGSVRGKLNRMVEFISRISLR